MLTQNAEEFLGEN